MKLKLKAATKTNKFKSLKLKELIAYVGGPDKVRQHCIDSNVAYRFMMKHQDKLVSELMSKGYNEVEELSNTVISDWCDNLFSGE